MAGLERGVDLRTRCSPTRIVKQLGPSSTGASTRRARSRARFVDRVRGRFEHGLDRREERLMSLSPRAVRLGLPTPLHPRPALGETLGVEVWFKRDDLTGQGLGRQQGPRPSSTCSPTRSSRAATAWSLVLGPQSNWAMLAALAARRRGLSPYLVFYGGPVTATGNLCSTELAGADVRFTGDPTALRWTARWRSWRSSDAGGRHAVRRTARRRDAAGLARLRPAGWSWPIS